MLIRAFVLLAVRCDGSDAANWLVAKVMVMAHELIEQGRFDRNVGYDVQPLIDFVMKDEPIMVNLRTA